MRCEITRIQDKNDENWNKIEAKLKRNQAKVVEIESKQIEAK